VPETSKTQRGNYEILSPLGVGAGGTVDTARCLADTVPGLKRGDFVAVKTLRETGYKSFQQEVEILRRLDHPNIVRYRDSFEWRRPGLDEESYCIVTELLEGQTLKERMADNPSGLPWAVARKILQGTLDALLYSIGKRVLHRDLKSSNIYVTHDNTAKVIDFGIARAHDTGRSTVAGGFKGTFDYMAPDFVTFQGEEGFHGDEQSDIFSFGVIFYEVVTGILPTEKLKGGNIEIEFVSRWLKNPPKVKFQHPVFDILVGARSCLRKCLEIDRTARYKTFQELQTDFATIRPRRLTHHNDVYEYVNYLGKGGFGKVFHARRVADGRDVAIKEMTAPDRQTRRFEREARILKELPHPRLVAYLDFVEVKEQALGDTRRFFLILEYLKGMPATGLSARIKSSTAGMEPQEVLALFIGYLEGLEVLHEKGIVHRDIKPGNLYAPEGEPQNAKIFDLGIAHDNEGTRTHGQVPGTLDYMPPEFAGQEGGRGSAQSDLYSLGVTFFQALTRQLPFDRLPSEESAAWAAFYMRSEKPQEYSFGHPIFAKYPALVEAMRRCLAHEPGLRYASAREMRNHLTLILKKMSLRVLEHEGEVYEFGARLGQGASGAIYQGQRNSDGLAVVIKELAADPGQMDRFESEARILQYYPHPHLVKHIAFVEGEESGGESRGFLILEFLKGLPDASLRERINRSPAGLELEETLGFFDSYLSCLEHLHGRRIYHRDIKPSNLYAPEGQPRKGKAFGLGVAFGMRDKPTKEPRPGTLAYRAPELSAEGARFSQQADLYSLGVTLYEALTGRFPFPQSSDRPLRPEDWDNVSYDHPVFGTPKGRKLAETLRRAIAGEPRNRFASAAEMRQALAGGHAPPPKKDDTTIVPIEDETNPPFLSLEVKVVEQIPSAPVLAGRKQLWVLNVEGNLSDDLSVKAASLSPALVPPEGVQAKVEDGKIKVFAQTLRTASGSARIELTVSSGSAEVKTELTFDIEPIPVPQLEVKVVDQIPNGRVRAGRKQLWLLNVTGNQPGDISVKATSLSSALVPPEGVQAKVEEGKIKVAAQTLESAGGPARIGLIVRSGTAEVKIELTLDIEPIPVPPLEVKVVEQVPSGPLRAGQKQLWVLDVTGNQAGDISVKATSLSPALVPQDRVQAKVEDGKIKVAAQPLETAGGPARIGLIVRSGTAEVKIELILDIEPVPPLEVKVVEQVPSGPVRAGQKQLWVLDVTGNESGEISVKATSLSPALVPQDRVQAKVEVGKIKVAALPLETARGPARIGLIVRSGTAESKIELTLDIEPIPPLEVKVVEQIPQGPGRAGRKQLWVLDVAGNESGEISVKATSLSPALVPQDRVQAKVEGGKIKVAALPLETARGPARIGLIVRSGMAEGKIELSLDIEPIPPLEVKVVEQVPIGPVRAGKKQLWVLDVTGNESGEISVKATSLSPALVPQDRVQAKVEDGKIKVAAQPLETARGPARIGLIVRSGMAEGKIELTLDIEPIPPLELKVVEQVPSGPVRAGKKQLWVLDVAGNESGELSVKATSLSPALVPQDRVQAKVEGGKIKFAALPLETARGPARIKISVSSGSATGEIELKLDIEPIPPLEVKVVEQIPSGPVRAGRKQLWVLDVAGNESGEISVKATSLSPALVPQDRVQAKVEDGKIKVAAQPLKSVGGPARIKISVSSGGATGETELKLDIEPIPLPSVELLTPQPLRLSPLENSLQLDFVLADAEGPAEKVNFYFKLIPPDLVRFDEPPKSGAPKRSLTLHRVPPRKGSGGIEVTVEADGRSATSRFDLQVVRPPRSPWPWVTGLLILALMGTGAFFYLRPSLSITDPVVNKTAGEEVVWMVKFRNARGPIKALSRNPEILPQESLSVNPAGDGLVRVAAVIPKTSTNGSALISVTMEGTDLKQDASVNISGVSHSIQVVSSPPSPSPAGKELIWELRLSPAEEADKVHAKSVNPGVLPQEDLAVKKTGEGKVQVTAKPPKTNSGLAQITVTIDGTDASQKLQTQIEALHSHLVLQTPESLRLPANQDSTQLTFSLKDDDLPVENLKFHFSVEPANLVHFDSPPVSGGAARTVTLSRATQFGRGTITVRVDAGDRSISTNYDLQVAANPIVITVPSGVIEIKPAAKEISFPLGIYDPYTPANEVQPVITADPAGIVKIETQHLFGTNWTVSLTRIAVGDVSGTLAIRIQGKGEPISTNIPFTLQARPKPALAVVGQLKLHVPLVKLHDPPLRIACHVTGSGPLIWQRKVSDNLSLLPAAGIGYEAPDVPGADGFIVLSPTRGKSGTARITFDVTADGALETNFVLQLDVEGEPTGPGLEVLPPQSTLEEGGHTNLSFGIKSDYFEPEQLSVSDTIEPPTGAELGGLPGALSSNFSLALSAGKPGLAEIKFILKDPNGRTAAQSVSARVLHGFRVAGPTNIAITAGTSNVLLTIFDEPEALRQMADPEVVSTTGVLSSRNWKVATTKGEGSNLVEITISSPGQLGGKDKDTLVVTATDLWKRKASQSIALVFVELVEPMTNKLGMALVWVPNLPRTGYAIWNPPGSSAPFQGGGWVAQDKVTQEQFTQLMGSNPSFHRISPNKPRVKNLPVENMKFQQAMDFCGELTKMDSTAGLLPASWRYTLPSVEQWAFYAANTPPTAQYAFFGGRDNEPIPLGTLAPNNLGLYDVLGDVFDLTRTPKTMEGKPGHIRRGGWCRSISTDLSTDPNPKRFENTWWFPDDPDDNPNAGPQTGFRVILVPDAAAI